MRQALVETLTTLMQQDDSIYLLTTDTGFHVFDEFQVAFADRYLNVGISEAAMIGMAAGLAVAGKRVFVYGIVPFVTMRCFEQIRVDLCQNRLPVTIIGVGGGLTYGAAGPTHHAIEDIAVMRSLPEMCVVCPGDPLETAAAVTCCVELAGPCYLRIGKTGEPAIHAHKPHGFAIGKGIRVREGEGGITILATGNMLAVGAEVCDILAASGVQPELISMHTVKPIDRELIVAAAARAHTLVTIEEHSIIGGLGSAVADVVVDAGLNVKMRRFALPDAYAKTAGSQAYLREQYGLTAAQIAEQIG